MARSLSIDWFEIIHAEIFGIKCLGEHITIVEEEIRNKLKQMRITDHEQIRQMFLRYDRDRNGFISRENIVELFRQINLPLENDLIDAVRENI